MLYFGRVGSSLGYCAFFGSSWEKKVITPNIYIYIYIYILSIAIETNEKSSEEVGWLPATMPEMTDPVTGGPSKDPRHWRL
jgi:hypothetical protein